MFADYWAHRHADDPNLRNQMVDDDFEETLRDLGFDDKELADVVDCINYTDGGE